MSAVQDGMLNQQCAKNKCVNKTVQKLLNQKTAAKMTQMGDQNQYGSKSNNKHFNTLNDRNTKLGMIKQLGLCASNVSQ